MFHLVSDHGGEIQDRYSTSTCTLIILSIPYTHHKVPQKVIEQLLEVDQPNTVFPSGPWVSSLAGVAMVLKSLGQSGLNY